MENFAVIKILTGANPMLFFFSLSSGLLVARKVKRKSSQAKAQRRRMPPKRSSTKRRRPAARMETAQRRVRPQRRVRGAEIFGHRRVLASHTSNWYTRRCKVVQPYISPGVDYTHKQDSSNRWLRLGDSLTHSSSTWPTGTLYSCWKHWICF